MSDLRPRPQYGEYATSEERLAAGGLPLEAAPPRPDTRIDPALLVAPAAPLDTPRGTPLGAKPASYDPAITAGLLGFGLVYIVFDVVPGAVDYAATVQQMYDVLGVGDFTPTAFASGAGVAILVIQAVLFLVAVVVSYRRVRAGRRAFFVPLVGGIVAAVVSWVLSSAVLLNDPAMTAYVDKLIN